MPAITITDLNNAKTDVDHVADLANSSLPTATDRLGRSKSTLQGAIDTIKSINNRGAWVTATAYNAKDIVSNAGTWYVCVIAHTSSPAFPTDSANWRVYQGVIAQDLAASSGSSLIGWIRSATGAVATTLAKWLGWQPPSVFEFMTDAQIADVQSGAMALDHTAAIQAALNSSLRIDFGGAENRFKVSGELTLRTGHRLDGKGASITQTATRTAIFRATSVNDISISGFKFAGVGADFNDSPSSLAVAVRGTTVARAKVFNNYFNNFSCAAAFFDFSSDVEVCDNVIVGPGSPTLTALTSGACYGVVVDGDRMLVSGNSITKTAQGIATGDGKDSIRITDNTIYNIVGQHGIYAGAGLTNLVISDNTVASTALIGIKVQNYDAPALNADNITITGNSVSSTGSHGIAVLSTTASAVYKLRNVTIVGNSIRTTTEDGINLGDITIGTVAGNTIYGSSREGITIGRLTSVRISDNTIREATRNGIRESAACSGCSIVDNTIQNCSSALVVGEKNGILIQLGDTFTIDGNVISDSASKMQYGLFISGGTQNGMIVRNNVCRGMTEYGARFKSPAEGFLAYSDNYFSGTTGPVLNDPPLPIVASASTITLPVGAKMVRISGTSTINTINTSGHAANQPVTLLFDSTAVVTRNGANILINATFNATQYDTLTIMTDGILWYEVARAVN